MTRPAFQTAMRAAAVAHLSAYASSASIKLQVYRARPATLYPPTAFVDRIVEAITYDAMYERVCDVEMVVVHGTFDSGEASDQKDAFVDGLIDYSMSNFHQAGSSAIVEVVSTADEPDYVAEWIRPPGGAPPTVYYATRITLRGNTAGG